MKFKLSIKNLGITSLEITNLTSVWMYLPTVFRIMYIATTNNSLINNQNINVVGNKKTKQKKNNTGAVDFKIDPWGSEQKSSPYTH